MALRVLAAVLGVSELAERMGRLGRTGGDDAPGPVLSARQESLAAQLRELIGEGPAAFFSDACVILSRDPRPAAASHIVAHLLREVESAVRSVLQPPLVSGGPKGADVSALAESVAALTVVGAVATWVRRRPPVRCPDLTAVARHKELVGYAGALARAPCPQSTPQCTKSSDQAAPSSAAPAATEPAVKVSHLHSNRQRLTAHVDRGLT
jgi:hypothetical protein